MAHRVAEALSPCVGVRMVNAGAGNRADAAGTGSRLSACSPSSSRAGSRRCGRPAAGDSGSASSCGSSRWPSGGALTRGTRRSRRLDLRDRVRARLPGPGLGAAAPRALSPPALRSRPPWRVQSTSRARRRRTPPRTAAGGASRRRGQALGEDRRGWRAAHRRPATTRAAAVHRQPLVPPVRPGSPGTRPRPAAGNRRSVPVAPTRPGRARGAASRSSTSATPPPRPRRAAPTGATPAWRRHIGSATASSSAGSATARWPSQPGSTAASARSGPRRRAAASTREPPGRATVHGPAQRDVAALVERRRAARASRPPTVRPPRRPRATAGSVTAEPDRGKRGECRRAAGR